MIVLDTHVWIWWAVDRTRLSDPAREAVESADEIGVSAISAWEVAMLVDRGRIEVDRPAAAWIRRAMAADPRTIEMPLTSAIGVGAVALGADGMHADPADRFILSTAVHHGAPLVTRDAAIRAFAPDRTVW